MRIEAVKRALMQAAFCGDQCDYWQTPDGWLMAMVDGLGHGEAAETAALAALAYVGAHLEDSLPELFKGCDQTLRGTRGAAMSLARLTVGQLEYAAIGNTQARILRRRMLSQGRNQRLNGNYGIVGGGYRQLVTMTAEFQSGDLLILHTDGVNERFDLSTYDESLFQQPSRLASRLIADWGKPLDDAAAMVCLNAETASELSAGDLHE